MTSRLSIITHTRNSGRTLGKLLATTKWADEHIVVDMQSNDDTAAIAQEAGCRLITIEPHDAVDEVRNTYLAEAQYDWVFVLDSDEHLADDAQACIMDLLETYQGSYDAFAIPRFNLIAGNIMRGSGWYPDHQIRLFKRGVVSWPGGHHGRPIVKTGQDRVLWLEEPHNLHIHHNNYLNLASLIEKQVHYALTDTYDQDGSTYDFGDYISRAYEQFNTRSKDQNDGDLSSALATVMAWDQVMRGLIHWEKLGKSAPLDNAFSLPVQTVDEKDTTSLPPIRMARNGLKSLDRWIRKQVRK